MARKIVIKVGTSVLTGGTRNLDRGRMEDIVRQCAELRGRGVELTLCTSGAIAAGQERLSRLEKPRSLPEKQMLAAVGQSRLMEAWEQLFRLYDIHVGQVLLTREDIADRERYLNARDVVRELLGNGIVPVINENDAVATAEIKVGDNDVLSALCTLLAGADLLLILTDQPGLFTGDPRRDPDAELIPEVRSIDEQLKAAAGGSVSGLGVGGMETKLEAAQIARRAGADVIIARGGDEDVILRVAAGERIGTRFPALETPLEGKRKWIFGGPPAAGTVVLDEGAVRALREKGSSLLPAGVVEVRKEFERGDTVTLVGPSEAELGRGIVRYSSDEIRKVAGHHSDDIPEILGYAGGAVVIHRDDLILV